MHPAVAMPSLSVKFCEGLRWSCAEGCRAQKLSSELGHPFEGPPELEVSPGSGQTHAVIAWRGKSAWDRALENQNFQGAQGRGGGVGDFLLQPELLLRSCGVGRLSSQAGVGMQGLMWRLSCHPRGAPLPLLDMPAAVWAYGRCDLF